jgi:DNA-binding GntR family transcriptional regulator
MLEDIVDREDTENALPLSAISGWTKSDWAYHEIRRRILDGTLSPGSLLEKETIAFQLGTSTTPVREAMRRLEAENLLISNAYRKVQVASLSETELQEIYAIRLVLDPLATRIAVEQATASDIARIEKLVSGRLAKFSSVEEQIVANREFHRAIHLATHNQVLIEILELLWDRTDRYRAAQFRETANAQQRTRDRQHGEIGSAFKARNSALASRLMRAHITDSAAQIPALTKDTKTKLKAQKK